MIVYKTVSNDSSMIFVHGLFGGRGATWTVNGINWPKDFLPIDLPQARILAFEYAIKSGFKWNEIGMLLFYKALDFRKNTRSQTRPLIFVVHGLGGVVVQAVAT